MKTVINQTGRKRITRDKVTITVTNVGGGSESFNGVVKLDGLGLPDEAKVYIEAYHHTELMRYSWGTVTNPVHPDDTSLSHLSHNESLKFRVMVVDESHEKGLILATADKIPPIGRYEKRSILPVIFQDLGHQVWKVDYEGDEPVLVLNRKIPNIHNLAKVDPHFHLNVYPAVIRDIFTHMFFVDDLDDMEEPSIEWHKNWITFAKGFLLEENIPQFDKETELNHDDKLSFIDKLVEEFCFSRTKEWSKLIEFEEMG